MTDKERGAEDRLQRFLSDRRRKTVSLDELQQCCCSMEYEDFWRMVQQMEADAVLQPVRASGQDFGGLSRKYRVFTGRLFSAGTDQIQQDIQQDGMSSRLDFSWYYRQPIGCWQQDRPFLQRLSRYIRQRYGASEPVSVQQRSYEIFGDEKFLLERGRALLSHVGISEMDLGIGGQPDPLMMAVNPPGLAPLVCQHLAVENKAAYYGLFPCLDGSGFASLIFGSGWKLVGNLSGLPQQCGRTRARHVVWYFGDFDWEGLSIWHALSAVDGIDVRLAVPFYAALLPHAAASGKAYQQKNSAALEAFCTHFTPDMAWQWQDILQRKRYYPQETLRLDELRQGWERLCDEVGKFS